jgi:phosphotransferase system  glucose/maltose/N-acetylglucosamine-specific IIC component
MFDQSFAFLQKIGKALMLPVAVLPVAGLLLGIGATDFHTQSTVLLAILSLMKNAGDVIFGNLPLIFAVGVALGFTENDGVAAIAATIGFLVMTTTLGVMAGLMGVKPDTIMGMPSIQTGVFGGILAGGLAAYMFNKYYRINLPQYLGFFAGKRFVPIVTAVAAIVLGAVLSFVWPPIGGAIKTFSQWAAVSDPRTAATVYGFVERLLIPFGLHHIWNVPFFFEMGDFVDASGKHIHGDINRFFAGDADCRRAVRCLPVQDVRPAGGSHCHLAHRQAGKPGESGRHHDFRRTDFLPDRHYRTHRICLPVRGSGAVFHPCLPGSIGPVRGQLAGHAHGFHLLARWHRLFDVQPDRQQIAQRLVCVHPGADLRRHLLQRVPLRHPQIQPENTGS